MTEHLPECPVAAACPGTFTSCICGRLRACEARVHEAAYQAGKAYGLTVNGYTRGLDAAREAVVVLCWRKQYEGFVSTVDPQRVLAAIDALKEEQ